MNNKDLISQYVDTGIGIPKYQFDKLSSNDKKTYLRKMEIRIESDLFNGDEDNLNLDNLDYYYGELPESTQIKIVSENGNYLPYITKTPSQAVQLAAVKNFGFAIQFIDNPSEQVQLEAVQQNGYSIQFIDNPSEQVQLAAVQKNGYSIRNIDNPTESVQFELLKHKPKLLVYVHPQNENVQMALVRKAAELHDYEYLSYLRKPTNDVLMLLKNKIMNINI
jgi:hypothetical protein